MRVLIVCSGNGSTPTGAGSIVHNQGVSLERAGIQVDWFLIRGHGLRSYLGAVPKLRAYLRGRQFNVVHAHYSRSAYVAALAGCRPLVVSLMGSDVVNSGPLMMFLRLFLKLFAARCIVKSGYMIRRTGIRALVVPNGVNFTRFADIPTKTARERVNFTAGRKYVIWVSNPAREEKNFALAQKAMSLINDASIELYVVNGVPHEDIPQYMYAADALLLSSRYEGSPNVIKEALYCNLPIVSTDVGDVRERVGNCDGCWIVNNVEEMAEAISLAVNHGKTNGREQVKNLDENLVAQQLIGIYKQVAAQKR